MALEVREAADDELEEAGLVTAAAYRALIGPGHDRGWGSYLDRIADARGRAARAVVLVALDDGRIVGSATLEIHERSDADDEPLGAETAHIRMLGVAPEDQGRGAGQALMGACEARAVAAGKTLMTLNTTPTMTTAQRMYEGLGYERGADRVFPDGFVLLSYAKRLPPSSS
jgi:ribosomal protein S18 acetylase RimI-like enzyme